MSKDVIVAVALVLVTTLGFLWLSHDGLIIDFVILIFLMILAGVYWSTIKEGK